MKLTDAEILAMVDNRIDILTDDIPRSGYGMSWEHDMPRPSRDKLQALRETIELLGRLESNWQVLLGEAID